MKKDQALKIIAEHVKNPNIIKHMLATEAVMKALAKKLEPEKEEEWGLVGLLHDGDYGEGIPVERQGIQISEWVEEKGLALSDEVKHAMAAHNADNTKIAPVSQMDWAIFACDSLTGLIVAATLVLPSKKLADLTAKSVLRRFKEPSFARGTRREDIKSCEEHLNLPLEQFVEISLRAMRGISGELGL